MAGMYVIVYPCEKHVYGCTVYAPGKQSVSDQVPNGVIIEGHFADPHYEVVYEAPHSQALRRLMDATGAPMRYPTFADALHAATGLTFGQGATA